MTDSQVSHISGVSGPEQGSSANDDTLNDSPVLQQVLGDALPKLRLFHVKLLQEGLVRGIIGPRDTNIIWERHILNSAAVVPLIAEATVTGSHGRVADVGSGGGFPGIVAAACLPDREFTLIEPMERRVEWLEECKTLMKLANVTILRSRAEESIAAHRRRKGLFFDVVTCRAVAPMRKLAGWTLPLLVPGGKLIALKGRSAQIELEKAMPMILKHGGINARVVTAEVGPDLESTHAIVIEKAMR